MEKLVFSV